MRGVCTSRKKQWPVPGIEELGRFQPVPFINVTASYTTFITGLFLSIEDITLFYEVND